MNLHWYCLTQESAILTQRTKLVSPSVKGTSYLWGQRSYTFRRVQHRLHTLQLSFLSAVATCEQYTNVQTTHLSVSSFRPWHTHIFQQKANSLTSSNWHSSIYLTSLMLLNHLRIWPKAINWNISLLIHIELKIYTPSKVP